MDIDAIERGQRLSDKVARQLAEAIDRGELKPGDRLPRERELTESFAVSRMVVREALSQLKSEGLIESRQGLGAFVATEPQRGSFRLRSPGDNGHDLHHIFELRVIVESAAAGMAATRSEESDVAAMQKALADIEADTRAGMDGAEADTRFHSAIASGAKNPFLERFILFLGSHLQEAIAKARANTAQKYPERIKHVQAEHKGILEAIRRRRSTEAEQAMHAHLEAAMRRLGL